MTSTLLWAIAIIVILAVVIVVLAWFYERATREVSLIRTGVGGRKVVMDGGTLALPYFHEISRLNMQTLRLEVHRAGDAALITKDRLRVDVKVEFYVSVTPEADSIARAAQTLGRRTFHADQLLELIEGKLVDALRSVAARLTMDDLHENRGTFVAEVRQSLDETLARNGLELESVSLSALDQTPFSELDENNAFNAVGMRKLAEVIATSKKERAEIDSDAEVSVRRAAMEASKRKLLIDLEEQEAQIAQTREIETLKAAQLAEVAKRKAEAEQEAAQARIAMEQEITAAEIAKERKLQEAEINRERDIEIANKERQIVLAAKSQEESRAQAIADEATAEAVKSSESITTVRQIADAERRLEIAGLTAKAEAETAGQRLRIVAEAEKDAAADRAKTTEMDADARKKMLIAEAEAQRVLIEAENIQDEHIVDMKVEMARLEALPKLVAEMVKPAEKIDSIKIHNISGLGQTGQASEGGGNRPVVNQAVDSILEMAVQLPALKKVGEALGISIEDGMTTGPAGRQKRKPGKNKNSDA